MTSRPPVSGPASHRLRVRWLVACAGTMAMLVGSMAQAQSPRVAAPASAPAKTRAEEGIRWQALTAPQREALTPLAQEWSGIDATRKQKWITLAARFPTLGPDERARITARMSEWARLTPAERGQARLRFEEARQLPAPDRNARWQAYQALPADKRQQLAARAASAAASGSGSTQRGDASVGKAGRARADSNAKSNLVPNPALAQAPRPVGPTVVQAGPGATTTLVTRRPAPPPHQQSGMPKIAATPEFVNRSTLLPRRGPQAAAVTTVAAPGMASGLVPPPGVTVSRPVTEPIVPNVPAVRAASPASPAASGTQ